MQPRRAEKKAGWPTWAKTAQGAQVRSVSWASAVYASRRLSPLSRWAASACRSSRFEWLPKALSGGSPGPDL